MFDSRNGSLLVQPGSYAVGPHTLHPDSLPPGGARAIDPHFPHTELERYTTGDTHGSILFAGLLVKVTPA